MSFTKDCAGKLTNEHPISKGVLLAAGGKDALQVSGLRWQKGGEHVLPASSMGSNILCERHNRALSELDRTAISVYTTLNRYQTHIETKLDLHGSEFNLVSGELFERFLLKMLWGETAAAVLAEDGNPIDELRAEVDLDMLTEFLFRDGSLPDGWGLYCGGTPGVEFHAEPGIALHTKTGSDGALWVGHLTLRAVTFSFGLARVEGSSGEISMRPQAVCLDSGVESTRKVLAFAWDKQRQAGAPVEYHLNKASVPQRRAPRRRRL